MSSLGPPLVPSSHRPTMGIRPIGGRDVSFAGVFVVAWLAMIAVYVLVVTFWGVL